MERSQSSLPEGLLADEVVSLLRELLHAILHSSMPAWLDLQLTLPQLRTLFLVAHGQTSSVMQVAQHLGIGEPTASHLVDRLAQAGLVDRHEDPEDRRRALLQLSAMGQELVEKLLGWDRLLDDRLQRLSQDDLKALHQGLAAIMSELEFQEGSLQ